MRKAKENISQETRDKMSNWQIGRKIPRESVEKSAKGRMIPVIQLDLDGNFIKEWESAATVQKEIGISSASIIACCKGKRKTAGSFKWSYK